MNIKAVIYENGNYVDSGIILGAGPLQHLLINLRHMNADLEIQANGVIVASYSDQNDKDVEIHMTPIEG